MRIAILSDIHGNLQALTKALEIVDGSSVDALYCLGDIVGYGGNPNECTALIRKRSTVVLLGNHDQAAVEPYRAEFFTHNARTAILWTARVLDADHKKYLSKLPLTHETSEALYVHANPAHPAGWDYIFDDDDARNYFDTFAQPVCFIGHSHIAFCAAEFPQDRNEPFSRGKRFVINVGSVGQPRDYDPRLSLGIFDTGTWSYDNIRVEYDIDGAADAILAQGLPGILAERLYHGQ